MAKGERRTVAAAGGMSRAGHPKGRQRGDETAGAEGPVRGALMDAALRLFTQRGYAAASVREIVAAAGVTKPVLYYHFGNKERLFLALMQTHFAALEAVVEGHRQGAGGVRGRLTAMFDEAFAFVQRDRDFIRLMHAVYFGPPGQAPRFDFDAYHRRYHDLVSGLMRQGIEAGEFRPGNAGDMAWVLLGTIEIAIEDQICDQAARIDRATLRRLLDLVLDGLAAEERRGEKG